MAATPNRRFAARALPRFPPRTPEPQAASEPAATGDAGGGREPPREFLSVSAGPGHTCAVKTGGDIVCWGPNKYDQATPAEGEFVAVSAGGIHTCGVKTGGDAVCWGSNTDDRATPSEGTFVAVSAGGSHTCGLRTDGAIACWGDYNSDWRQYGPPQGDLCVMRPGQRREAAPSRDGVGREVRQPRWRPVAAG